MKFKSFYQSQKEKVAGYIEFDKNNIVRQDRANRCNAVCACACFCNCFSFSQHPDESMSNIAEEFGSVEEYLSKLLTE